MSAFGRVVFSVAVIVSASAGFVRAEDTSASQMRLKDNVDVLKKQIKLQIRDSAIDAGDGYAANPIAATLSVYSRTTAMHTIWYSDVCTPNLDKVECESGKSKVTINPGDAKLTIKADANNTFELDGLQNQLPIVMVLSLLTDLGNVEYCAVCGDGGADEVKKDGSDGKQILVKNCNSTPCPAETQVCCDTARCVGGVGEADCIFEESGTIGGAGSVCDATGNCVAAPGEPAGCCDFGSSCGIGSAFLCNLVGGDSYSNASTCQADGECTAPPRCTGYATQCQNRSSCVCSNDGYCIIGSADETNCSTNSDCAQGKICTDFIVEKLCREPCY